MSITRLNIFTKYYVAVKASTAEGTGPLGDELDGTTDQECECLFAFYAVIKTVRWDSHAVR